MKFNELPTTGRGGRALEVENAVVGSVALTTADHGVLTGWLHLEFGAGGCGFGGFMLGKVSRSHSSSPVDYAAEFVVRCLRVGGVDEWSELKGQPVRVLHEGLGGGIVAVGHFIKDDWFCPQVEWKK